VDDHGLIERMRQGDESAFADVFARHRTAVYRYAVHMAGHAAADDIVQETFLVLIRQLPQFDPKRGTLRAYLLGIARRQMLNRFVTVRETEPIDEESGQFESCDSDPFEDLTRAEIVSHVRGAIVTLPLVYREAIVLCDLNEADYETAAVVMNCPVGTVRSRLHRARALLLSKLSKFRPGVMVANGQCRR
jgi:RNA polymerase sigma-70 factor, ECF subfamily